MSTRKRADEEDEAQHQGDEWALGTWHCYHHIELHCVVRIDGKPRVDYHPTSERHTFYRWRSYHAARKFQRSHPELAGYVIVNLSEIERQCSAERERRHASRKGE